MRTRPQWPARTQVLGPNHFCLLSSFNVWELLVRHLSLMLYPQFFKNTFGLWVDYALLIRFSGIFFHLSTECLTVIAFFNVLILFIFLCFYCFIFLLLLYFFFAFFLFFNLHPLQITWIINLRSFLVYFWRSCTFYFLRVFFCLFLRFLHFPSRWCVKNLLPSPLKTQFNRGFNLNFE